MDANELASDKAETALAASIDDLEAGMLQFAYLTEADHASTLAKPYVVINSGVAGRMYVLAGTAEMMQNVKNASALSIDIDAPAGCTFENGSAVLTMHEGTSAMFVLYGSTVYVY